jgi:4-hydroxy 2-oxovalerate aldolase
MVSGVTSSPQKDVMEWVTKYLFSFNSVIQAMENRKNGSVDNEQLPNFKPDSSYQKAVIIGGGPNVLRHFNAVRAFLVNNPDVCVIHASSKNAKYFSDLDNDQYFCLVGNEGQRLERVFQDLKSFTGVCVLPPYPREMGTYIPPTVRDKSYELRKFTFLPKPEHSLTATALQCAIDLGVSDAYFAGYDGYTAGNISQRERDLFLENEAIFEAARTSGLNCHTLLPTKYENLQPDSVYARV